MNTTADANPMRVLVIGGTGFVSSSLVREALERGHAVTTVTRGSANRPAPPAGVEVIHADRTDPEAFGTALAGRTFDLVLDAVLYRPTEASAIVDLFAGRIGRYILISTDFVYGGEPRTFPLSEDAPRRALSSYGVQKAAAEDVLFAAHVDRDFPAVVLRPGHILGAGCLLGTTSREGRDRWLAYRLRQRMPIFLVDGGSLLIQPVHRDDIAKACFAVAASDVTPGRPYNIFGPDAVTVRRYYEIVCELLGLDPAEFLDVVPLPAAAYLAAYPDRGPFTLNRIFSTERLRRDTGFSAGIGLREALSETLLALEAKGSPPGDPPTADDPLLIGLLRKSAA